MLLAPLTSRAQRAEVLVESNVADAAVVIDGTEVGRTNEEGEAFVDGLSPGQRRLELRKPGYWNASVRVTLEPGLTTPLTLELRPRPGAQTSSLMLKTNVPRASVSLDGKEIGKTSAEGQLFMSDVALGRHQVNVRKEGYESVSRTLTVNETGLVQTMRLLLVEGPNEGSRASTPDDATELGITTGDEVSDSIRGTYPTEERAQPRPAQSSLIVDAGVAEATVRVNDSVYGRTGPEGLLRARVDTGRHRVAVSKEAFQADRATARVGAREMRTVTLSLQPAEPEGKPGTNGRVFLIVGSLLGLGLIVVAAIMIGTPASVLAWWRRFRQGQVNFDRYRLLGELDGDVASTTYLAYDPDQNQQVRLRILDETHAEDPDYVHAFLEEGRILQRLHQSVPDAPIVTAYRIGREGGGESGRPFLVLEPLLGRNLRSHLDDKSTLPVGDALAIIRQVCIALRAAHENGACHGSLTPKNVIITSQHPEYKITLTGFGNRGGESDGRILENDHSGDGRPYQAPETFDQGRSTWQSDIYAVGMLFYTMITGAPPFIHDDSSRVVEMHKEAPRPDLPDHVPAPIQPLFQRMVSPDPNRRPTAKKIISVPDLV